MMNYKKLNNIVGWVVFAIAAFTYLSTLEASTSLWDCGEYISTSYKLEVGHPPGAPLFMMIGRLFSAFVDPVNAAWMVNATSGLSSAFGILFLFWSITLLAGKIVFKKGEEKNNGDIFAVLGAGAVGALAYTFSDTYWFSAVEGEVYAMSSFFTAITFWGILKWEQESTDYRSDRWIIFIFFMVGLAIGVHFLNLLVVPAVAFIYYFKNYKFSIPTFFLTGIISIIILGIIFSIIIPQTVSIASAFEVTFTNSFGMPFNTGTIAFLIMIIGLTVFGLFYAHKRESRLLHVIVMSTFTLLLGYSAFAMIMIRSNANTPLDENDPETLPALLSYLNREQYGDWPKAYGPYWNSPQEQTNTNKVKSNTYFKAYTVNIKGRKKSFQTEFAANEYLNSINQPNLPLTHEYIVAKTSYETEVPAGAEKFYTVLPRMYSPQPEKVQGYMWWSGYEGDKTKPVPGKTAQNPDKYSPKFSENMRYMFNYQFGWMYFRYFLWNFVGRQNDIQGHGYYHEDGMYFKSGYTRGNWLSGVDFIDSQRLGKQEFLPSEMTQNEGYNTYFFLPLILGLIGLIFHIYKAPKDATVLGLLFFMTGLAIILYLNQKPEEPRERDYAYAASFYVFAIWIGIGVIALYNAAKEFTTLTLRNIAIGVGSAFILFYGAEFMNNSNHALSYSILFIGLIGMLMMGIMYALRNMIPDTTKAIIASLIGLVIPAIMAAENWDDHDRSNRYFAREIARNYLDSCGKNAILFCFGDNDTFPLWYIQEVEEHRTDMKVINYALLSSDWHYSQLIRMTYDAPMVKTTLKEPDYRRGTRDYIFVKGTNDSPAVEASEVLRYIQSDKDISNVRLAQFGYASIPFRNVYINVDKEAAIKSGLVSESERDQIEDRISWTIGGNMSKADLAILDVLANYDWSRPISFTSNYIQGSHSGLKNYIRSNGITSTLVPIRNAGPNEDVAFDNMVNKFEWGNINQEGIYVDYYTMRMIRSVRISFLQLAENFLRKGQIAKNASIKDSTVNDISQEYFNKAEQVLDKAFETLPIDQVKMEDLVTSLGTLYYRIGSVDKGNEICGRIAEKHAEMLRFINNQDNEMFIQLLADEGGRAMYFIEDIKKNGGTESIPEDYEALVSSLKARALPLIQGNPDNINLVRNRLFPPSFFNQN